jgi:hypothetical protein
MMSTAFDKKMFNTSNPAWTKRKKGLSINSLADHICTRTPPLSYGNRTNLEMIIVKRNYRLILGWYQGLEIICNAVEKRLIERDGSL